jgi:glycosyltransferase involved in cell wall biosynthesis
MDEAWQILDVHNVLVIIPAFSEEKSVGHVVEEIMKAGFQVLVVDDGSMDATAKVAKKNGASVLQLPINLGVGGALRAGFKYACLNHYQAVLQVDADGQHPVNQINDLLVSANFSQAHLVIGSRFLTDQSLMEISKLRRVMMKMLATSASIATGTRITDASSGFRVISEPLLTEFSQTFSANYLGDTYEALIMAGRSKYKVREVPASITERLHGESSATFLMALLFSIKVFSTSLLRIHPQIRRYKSPKVETYVDDYK